MITYRQSGWKQDGWGMQERVGVIVRGEFLKLGNLSVQRSKQNFPIKNPVHYDCLTTGALAFLACAGLANLLFPKEPLKIFPFLVFLSPLPMICFLVV